LCSLFPQCGGCQIQHFSFEHQRQFKQQMVKQAINHIGKIDVGINEVMTMDDPWKYRNKMQLPLQYDNGEIKMGFYRVNSHNIIPFENCWIQSDLANKIVNYIQVLLMKYEVKDDIRHLVLKTQHSTSQVMVVLVCNKIEVKNLAEIVKDLTDEFEEICSIIQNINDKKTNVIFGDAEIVLYGNEYVVDYMGDFEFHISARSFYQVNPQQAQILYEKAIELAEIDSCSKVVDVYCGVGTITMFLAKHAKEVIGIEIVTQAIENAKNNAKRNNISNVTFMLGSAKDCTKKLVDEEYDVDVVVVDPPRKGCDNDTLEALVEMEPKRIVYVSCNPATLARDLRYLEDNNYKVTTVQPVDMFPQTYHTEVIVLLQK
jgi:23S rRNA (uracil-5-)-methyltransferase RumA